MHNFDRKVEEAGARVNQKVADVAERLERETTELITYLNNEVVPAIRAHSTKALRVAADKLAKMADYLDEQKRTHL
jgi:KaiC/GvpD/RAD55 family RecA-like ATPase